MNTCPVLFVSFQGLILDLLGEMLDLEKVGLLLHTFVVLLQSAVLMKALSDADSLTGDGCLLVSLLQVLLFVCFLPYLLSLWG